MDNNEVKVSEEVATPETEKLTDEQVHKVYEALEDENTSKETLEKAKEETENSNYTELGETSIESETLGAIDTNVVENKSDYIEAFSPYGLNDEDAIKLFNLICDYKVNKVDHLYEKLPDPIKKIADGLCRTQDAVVHKINKDYAAKFIIDNFINDAKLNKAIDDFNSEMNETMLNMNREYDNIMNSAIEDTFDKIEQLKVDNPEQAAKIEKVKKAFDEAMSYERQIEYLKRSTSNKLRKKAKRLDGDSVYFNNRVNITDIRMPNIAELPEIIKKYLPGYDIITIKKFVHSIIATTVDLPIDMDEHLDNLAYIYRLLSNIYNYKYTTDSHSDKFNIIFGNITNALDLIENLN